MIAGKIWGQTQPLWSGNNVELHRIHAKQGGYSSKHRHRHKFNLFFVESGTLEIKVWRHAYNLVDTTIVPAGKMTIVPPGEHHQFKALFDTIAFEVYWTQLDSEDIERKGHGGSSASDVAGGTTP